LLVDDFADAREMYAEYLNYSGFDVLQAADGVEALEYAVAELPDLILMDLALPLI
jgi:DNA-binding response OmpR family regulator